ncbi:AAA-like domain-containing protein [Elizabethkingia miricola]|uniref:AAA-like domain-containing protein n=1 Tax=Elizabethkingia miricola TaxID=172045 RepID=UPI003891D4F4
MERILKKYTTIPNHLYVDRQADYQLKNIIEDMQRPGYVLVARQMGKTNLLLNAKRNLQNEERIIVYIDLSNLYEDEISLYRNIIDIIIELNENLFKNIESEILNLRQKKNTAHNEYLRSLLILLKNYKGNVVIILDEIDALKSKDYSDNIFAQIRSNYFSRTNYEELERLTYILSGVIEPTDLIKDKNKSPFNIGEKIYLDDFSFEEHRTFIYKSRLHLSNELSEYLFRWLNGNPRMTYDVCSELEKIILEGNSINEADIDEIIRKKYLTTFDVAPIDHIRELLKYDEALREAIKCMYNNKRENISDEIKKKLYLYGVISSDFNSEINLKNNVIKEAISIEWLNSLEEDITFFKAEGKYIDGYYHEAIELFEKLLVDENYNVYGDRINLYIGQCYYSLNDFKKAIEHLSQSYSEDYKYDADVFLGLAKLKSGDLTGLEILENISQSENKNKITYYLAIINIALNTNNQNKALDLLSRVVSAEENTTINIKELQYFKTLAHYLKSNIFEKKKLLELALKENEDAIKISDINIIPILLLNKINLNNLLENDCQPLKQELVSFIVDNNIKFNDQIYYPISFNRIHLSRIFQTVIDEDDKSAFERLLSYVSTTLLKGDSECYDLILKLDEFSYNLANFILEHKESNLNLHHKVAVLRNLSFGTEKFENDVHISRYIELITKKIENYKFSDDDYELILSKTIGQLHHQNFKDAYSYITILLNLLSIENDNKQKHIAVIVYFSKLVVEINLKLNLDAVESSNKILSILNSIDVLIEEILPAETLKLIRRTASNLPFVKDNKFVTSNGNQVILKNKIVKVKYLTGRIITSKFKRVEKDIIAGKCHIIE